MPVYRDKFQPELMVAQTQSLVRVAVSQSVVRQSLQFLIANIGPCFPPRSGPVVFPPSPANAPVESSGVVVGASGFGFVPPQSPQSKNYF